MNQIKQLYHKIKALQLETKLLLLCVVSIFFTAFCAGVVCFFVALTFIIRKNTRQIILHASGFWPIAGLSVIGIVAALFTRNWLGLFGCVTVMVPLFIFFFVAQKILDQDSIRIIFRILHVLSILAAVFALCQFVFYKDLLDKRPFSFFHNPNLYANIICLVSILSVALIISNYDKKYNGLYITAMSMNIIALYLSSCRTAWPAIAIGVLVMMLFLRKYRSVMVFSGLFVAAAVCIYLDTTIVPRSFLIEGDILVRFDIMKIAFGAILKRPVFGGGIFYFNIYSVNYVGMPLHHAYIHAHNLLLNFLVDFGVVGFGCLTVYFITILKPIFKTIKISSYLEGAVAIGAVAYTFIHGMLDVTAFNVQTGEMFLLFMAIALAAGRTQPAPLPNPDSITA